MKFKTVLWKKSVYLVATIILGIYPAFATATAAADSFVQEPANFSYELHLSDVDCWINRECAGKVDDYENGEIAQRLDEIMSTATKSLDLAIYGIRNQDWLIKRLKTLKADGVKIRLTLDQVRGELGDWETTQNFPYPDAFKLVNLLGRRSVKPDVNPNNTPRTGSIMHNKFFVVDHKAVWAGSMNFSNTGTGTEYNANSSILIHSRALANIFTREFDQMFVDRKYGYWKTKDRSRRAIKFKDGTTIKTFFSPQNNPTQEAIIPFIASAQRSLDIGIFYLTSPEIADELLFAKRRGVDVKIINDATAARHPASVNSMLRAGGIDVRVENWGGKMHMKTAVADNKHVIIGSMNWSKSGNDDNDENILLIENNRGLAYKLVRYFDKLYNALPTSLISNYRSPSAESTDSINSCVDGINNDHVGGMDQQVPACR